MRQMRSQARDLANQESQIARDLDALNNSAQKPLDDSSQRQSLVEQMARQQSALTNLLGEMRAVTEQAESTEPLLSKQLYDILRRADQMHTDNQLEIGAQLVDRGFLPQASQAERSARQNIDELRQSVDRAAESVLGSEAEALRYAQKELDDLAGQMAREMSARTNSTAPAAGESSRRPGPNEFPGNGRRPRRQATWQRAARTPTPWPAPHPTPAAKMRRLASDRIPHRIRKSAGREREASAGKQSGECESGAAAR